MAPLVGFYGQESLGRINYLGFYICKYPEEEEAEGLSVTALAVMFTVLFLFIITILTLLCIWRSRVNDRKRRKQIELKSNR